LRKYVDINRNTAWYEFIDKTPKLRGDFSRCYWFIED
jgi:hypothetical protein